MPNMMKSNDSFALFQHRLIGTWTNKDFPGTNMGGTANPLSYNVMPLPQNSPWPKDTTGYPGYILKNFTYHETIRFNNTMMDPSEVALSVRAPNRGGEYEQDVFALFYSQQVQFAQGPAKGQTVHVENGAWLYLVTHAQRIGPYGTGDPGPGEVVPQPSDITIAKQISVPHGNSILALGSFDMASVSPVIPNASAPYPSGTPALSTAPYTDKLDSDNNYQNPQPDFTANPNLPLQQAVAAIKPTNYIHFHVTTKELPSGQGSVTNIPFEQRVANVSDYSAEYWLLSTDGGKNYKYLAYTQNISLEIPINGHLYLFPHITSNVVTKES